MSRKMHIRIYSNLNTRTWKQ